MTIVRIAGAATLLIVLAACQTTPPPPPADSKTAAERSYDAMWGFECASLAGHMNDPGRQKKLYENAHQAALWFAASARGDGSSQSAPALVQATLEESSDPDTFADRLNKTMKAFSDSEVDGAARVAAGANASAAEIDAAMASAARDLYYRRVCRRFEHS